MTPLHVKERWMNSSVAIIHPPRFVVISWQSNNLQIISGSPRDDAPCERVTRMVQLAASRPEPPRSQLTHDIVDLLLQLFLALAFEYLIELLLHAVGSRSLLFEEPRHLALTRTRHPDLRSRLAPTVEPLLGADKPGTISRLQYPFTASRPFIYRPAYQSL